MLVDKWANMYSAATQMGKVKTGIGRVCASARPQVAICVLGVCWASVLSYAGLPA